MEIARDEVRVMTVHGAKGLEAPVVILADTTTNPTGPKPPRLLKLGAFDFLAPRPPLLSVTTGPDQVSWGDKTPPLTGPSGGAGTASIRNGEIRSFPTAMTLR